MYLETLPKNLLERPEFHSFELRDINPLGKTVKKRLVYAPNDGMRMIHEWLILFLRTLDIKLPYATGGMPGSDPLENVRPHARNRFFYLLDIKNFYPSINGEKLASIICSLSPALENREANFLNFLKKYCLDLSGGLLIGSPSSPDLANIFAGILLDRPLGELAKRYGLTYTRYLDDMTFSSPAEGSIGKVKRLLIREAVLNTGFQLNHGKAHWYDLVLSPIVITGVGLEYGGRTFLPRHFLRKVRQMIHLAMIGKEDPAKVYGMMGAFYATTGRRNLNWTELKLVMEYNKFRQKMNHGREKQCFAL